MDLPVVRLGSAVALVFGGLGFVLGVVLLWRYLGTALFAYRLLRTDPVTVETLSQKNTQTVGVVQVQGVVSIADGKTVEAPVSGTDCLAYEYERQARQDGRLSHWETVTAGEDGVPFLVDDDTGLVQVDPDGCEFQLETETVDTGDIDLSNGIADTETFGSQSENGSDAEERHLERRLDVGQSVRVYGRLTPPPTDEWGRNRAVARVTGRESPLVISDRSSYATAWRSGKQPFLWTAIGTVSLCYGLSMLVYGLWLLV